MYHIETIGSNVNPNCWIYTFVDIFGQDWETPVSKLAEWFLASSIMIDLHRRY